EEEEEEEEEKERKREKQREVIVVKEIHGENGDKFEGLNRTLLIFFLLPRVSFSSYVEAFSGYDTLLTRRITG
ncbi:hypothetical protein Csa_023827, partial [Cucumis sativus]